MFGLYSHAPPQCRCAGRPWGGAKNASMTKAAAISPSSFSMGTHWVELRHWLAMRGDTMTISTCSPGALHVGTPAGSSVAYGRFEGAKRPIFRIKGDPEHIAVQIYPRGHSNPQLVWGRPWGPPPKCCTHN